MIPPAGRQEGDVWEQSIEELLNEWQSGDGCRPGKWESVLAGKRMDPWYREVLESVRLRGFTRPLTCWLPEDECCEWCPAAGQMCFGDGHHRLAAAIDLGLTHVPLQWRPKGKVIAFDSGEGSNGWNLEGQYEEEEVAA